MPIKLKIASLLLMFALKAQFSLRVLSMGWLLLGPNPTGTDVPRSTCADSPSALETTLFASLVHAAQKHTEARLSRESRLIPITKEFPP